MTRSPILSLTQTAVLTKSRRRCCICFGLNRDVGIKAGQIAHLDQKSSNSAESNLAFMCLLHHDQYDSVTSQSKGIRREEVLHYRDELYATMEKAMASPVAVGQVPASRVDIAGRYEGGTPEAGATVNVVVLGLEKIRVYGQAYYGASNPKGPNLGLLELNGFGAGQNVFAMADKLSDRKLVKFRFEFVDGGLRITEEDTFGYFGMNVTFRGAYRKAGDAQLPMGILSMEGWGLDP